MIFSIFFAAFDEMLFRADMPLAMLA